MAWLGQEMFEEPGSIRDPCSQSVARERVMAQLGRRQLSTAVTGSSCHLQFSTSVPAGSCDSCMRASEMGTHSSVHLQIACAAGSQGPASMPEHPSRPPTASPVRSAMLQGWRQILSEVSVC